MAPSGKSVKRSASARSGAASCSLHTEAELPNGRMSQMPSAIFQIDLRAALVKAYTCGFPFVTMQGERGNPASSTYSWQLSCRS